MLLLSNRCFYCFQRPLRTDFEVRQFFPSLGQQMHRIVRALLRQPEGEQTLPQKPREPFAILGTLLLDGEP